jgi:serine/threonine protein kinase
MSHSSQNPRSSQLPYKSEGQSCLEEQQEQGKSYNSFIDLIDIDIFTRLQFSIAGAQGSSVHIGQQGPGLNSWLLGRGGSFDVRRVWSGDFPYTIDLWEEVSFPKQKFVVEKKPLVDKQTAKQGWKPGSDNSKRFNSVLLELKILFHKPIRKHPNIIRLYHLLWDTQDQVNAIAPSLVMEYAELGALSDFQDPEQLVLNKQAKNEICLDIARGLQFLHQNGIIHGDVKAECVLRIYA